MPSTHLTPVARPRRLVWAISVLLVPALMALVPLLAVYAETAAHWTVLLRPAAVSAAIVSAITLATFVVTRKAVGSALLVGELVWLVFEWRVAVVIALILIALWVIQRFRRRSLTISPSFLLVSAALLVIATSARAVSVGTVALEDFQLPTMDGRPVAAATNRPNVFVLLLDGYPRQDTLKDAFAFDNEPFLSELDQLGFAVNRTAETTFARTELTLASMNVEDATELEVYEYGEGVNSAVARRAVRRERLVNSPVMDGLRRLGYRLDYVPPPVTFVDWGGWDERHDPGQVTDFESVVIQRTPLRFLLDEWVLDQSRDRIDATLDAWTRSSGQRFVLAHLMAPHPPFLWTSEGEMSDPLPCWYEVQCSLFNGFPHLLRLSEGEFVELVPPQVAEVNSRVLRAVRRIVETDPDAVIVLFSDHGTRYRDLHDTEATRTLFAARNTGATAADGLFWYLLDELNRETP